MTKGDGGEDEHQSCPFLQTFQIKNLKKQVCRRWWGKGRTLGIFLIVDLTLIGIDSHWWFRLWFQLLWRYSSTNKAVKRFHSHIFVQLFPFCWRYEFLFGENEKFDPQPEYIEDLGLRTIINNWSAISSPVNLINKSCVIAANTLILPMGAPTLAGGGIRYHTI